MDSTGILGKILSLGPDPSFFPTGKREGLDWLGAYSANGHLPRMTQGGEEVNLTVGFEEGRGGPYV